MEYPRLKSPAADRQTLQKFGGINRLPDAPEGTFSHMENMTSDHYPALSCARGRQVYAVGEDIGGIIAKDCLCYIDSGDFVMNGYRTPMGLTPGEKNLISMGAYVVIFPDKKYINTLDLTDFGDLEAEFVSTADVQFTLCDQAGGAYDCVTAPTAPESPENGQYWLDTSVTPAALRRFSAQSGLWADIAATYIKIASPGIGRKFAQYDAVEISGVLHKSLQDLNGSLVVWNRGEDYLVVAGIIPNPVTQSIADAPVKVERRLPEMDHVIECGNRLWGCRYGTDRKGNVVNEIYCSKLGDFKNFSCYMGLSTDSFTASVGTDGPFTGAVEHLGYPLFFKENALHKVYGSMPSTYQLQTTACRGVGLGCHKSLVTVEGALYYCSQDGVWSYDGSLPRQVSRQLGDFSCTRGVAGGWQGKYYLSTDADLWVYDTYRKLWHREDSFLADGFAACPDGFFALSGGKLWDMLRGEQPVSWSAQTAPMGLTEADRSYISRLTARLALEPGSTVSFFIRYDASGPWEPLATLMGSHTRSFQLPLRTRRCDHMELLLRGKGPMKLYALTKTVEKGSDAP